MRGGVNIKGMEVKNIGKDFQKRNADFDKGI